MTPSLTRIGLGHCLNERFVATSNNGPSHWYQEVLVCALYKGIHTSIPVGLMKREGGRRGWEGGWEKVEVGGGGRRGRG